MPNPQNNPYLMSEADIPENWHPIETEPTVPGASPAAYAATPSMPPYYRGSIDSNLEHDAQFVATDRTPRVTSIPLMPVAPSGNPQTNAAIQSIIKINQSSSVIASSGVIFRGVWNPLTAYTIGNIVTYNGSSYVAITGSLNLIPWSNPTNWTLLGKNINLRGVYTPPVATVQQSVSNTTINGTPTSVTFGSNVLAGSRIIVTTYAGNIGSTTVPTMTDSQGNTYSQVVASSRIDSNEYQAQLWISSPVKAGSLTVTVLWVGGTTPGNGTVFATEIAHLISSPVDASGSAAVKAISGPFPAIDVTVVNGNLLYTGAFADATNTVPTGYTGDLAGSQTINVAWLSGPAPGLNAIQWNGTLNNSSPRFTGVAVSLMAGNTSLIYMPYDLVEFEGSAWLCIGSTFLSPTSDPTNWALFAQGTGFVNSQAADYTALAGDQGRLISYDSGSAHTLKLPATPPNSGWWIAVENVGAGALTINPNGLLLDGSSSSLVLQQNQGLAIFTDGLNYFTMRGMGSGGVTSLNGLTGAVDITAGIGISVSVSSPDIQISSTSAEFSNQNAKTALMGPVACSSPALPTFRQPQGTDFVNLNIASASMVSSVSSQSGNLRLCGSVLPAGLYRVSVYIVVTNSGAGNLSMTITWNDGTASQSYSPSNISTTSIGTIAQFDIPVLADGINDVSYAFTLI